MASLVCSFSLEVWSRGDRWVRPSARAVAVAVVALLLAAPIFAQEACPTIDPFEAIIFDRYPPEATSVTSAQLAPSGSAREGIDRLLDLVMRSLAPGCTPVRLILVHGTADFDARGTAFEDHVSVERAFQAMKELKAEVEAVRAPAAERGEIRDLSVSFTFGGLGTRSAKNRNPASEAERAENRSVIVRLLGVPEESAAPVDAPEPSDALDAPESEAAE